MKEKAVDVAFHDIYEEMEKELNLNPKKSNKIVHKKYVNTKETEYLNKLLGI